MQINVSSYLCHSPESKFCIQKALYLSFSVYFDASDNCNSLDFQLGNVAKGVSASATYSWSIKVNQYSCDYENLAP